MEQPPSLPYLYSCQKEEGMVNNAATKPEERCKQRVHRAV